MVAICTFAPMEMEFYKYQGTGNDFVLIDNRQLKFSKNNTKLVAHMCDRKFGIGADGLILLENHPDVDFTMVYYNADGNLSSMCGNGGRCITHFAKYLGLIEGTTVFEAIDGKHEATINNGLVSLRMHDVSTIQVNENHTFLDTGSPHHVQLVDNLDGYDVYGHGKRIRTENYGLQGSNINFVEQKSETVFGVRTYERGVENETLSCGTGVTAVALSMHATGQTKAKLLTLETPGGDLKIQFDKNESGYHQIYLIGPATMVFKGIWNNAL